MTAHLLEFDLGTYGHAVDEDVEQWQGVSFPETLTKLDNKDLVTLPAGPL